jgi:hypothetical protein
MRKTIKGMAAVMKRELLISLIHKRTIYHPKTDGQ